MARLNNRAVSSDAESTPESSSPRRNRDGSETPLSPVASTTSDKENSNCATRLGSNNKRKTAGTTLAPPSAAESSSFKRRKMDDRRRTLPDQSSQREAEERLDKQFYDPDQDEDERRAIKRRMRENEKEFYDNRADYLKSNSDGIKRTLKNADEIFRSVKQTSDATIDSRLLVGIADLSKKKITELALGDSSIGVDVDEFVSKCIAFMNNGAEAGRERAGSAAPGGTQAPTQTQRRRGRRRDDDDEEDAGDALNWDYLGKNACFLHNSRPCVSGFLLGPLSVQKKIRQQTQRRAREARANPANALRPMEMLDEDLEKTESANLTVICKEIADLLYRVQQRGQKMVEREFEKDDSIEEDKAQNLMRAHGVADDGQVPLFDFCVNPKSFGQTVENMFYVSFLVKEGKVGFNFDSRGLPTLGLPDEKTLEERQETTRNQAVFTLDFDTWEAIVESNGIKESIIPHRDEVDYDDGTGEGRTGWYD